MSSDKVKVAVRVRPFNRREIELETESVVEVTDQQIILHYLTSVTKGERRSPKVFAFDSCFWSFDENDEHFASQDVVYKHCGVPVLSSAFEGYNACIFAYGQTGSGKSYTMMGSPDNKGLIPKLCDGIFERIACNKDASTSFKVEVSYMEIYNEKVHDLLDPRGVKQNLRVREHNILGPYVDGLSTLAVSSFEEIDNLMAEGNKSRTVAATNMNSESSRSHAVFTITLTCSVSDPESGVCGEKVSKMSLVDLAGSERAVKTGAIGERLKEGSNINKSLTTLGLVISKLADSASGKSKGEQFVPYRDSVLTWLLKDNLGGNSKTVMVATISPAADNYEETLSTLRYADRAKRIVNHAVINEDPNARMIRELREEVEMLREQLKNAAQQEDLRERLVESEKLIKEMTQTWEEKLRKTETIHQERQQALEKMGISVQSSGIKVETDKYYLVNLNADPSLNELLVYYLKEKTLVGRSDAPVEQDIQLSGIGIMAEHCVIEIDRDNNELFVMPFEGAKTCVNGSVIKSKTSVKHGDRLLWGNNHFFKVACPRNVSLKSRPTVDDSDRPIDFQFAREEFMMKELCNDPIQNTMKSLEKQYEDDKNRALEQQRAMYEKQLQMLRNQLSPSTPYASYTIGNVIDSFGLSASRSSLTSPSVQSRMEKWAKERDEIFKKSLAQLKEDIVRANSLVLEANCLAQEMSRNTEFKVTLQIPAENLTPNRRKGAFVSEPAVLVKRKSKAPQVWSMEKLENKLIDMRELYEEWKEKGGLLAFKDSTASDPSLTLIDPFYESQENHHLIGVANVFLEVLFHDVFLDYHVPIISQQGEVAGRLHIEIGRISGFIGERMADASDSCTESESDSSTRNQIVVRLAIKSARGLPVSLSNYVFCQYSFWGCSDAIVVPPLLNGDQNYPSSRNGVKENKNLQFEHVNEFSINVTEEFLEHCAEGALSIEVWGHRSVGFSSMRTEWEITDAQTQISRSLADRWAELKRKIELWVEIHELNEQGEYSPVEVTPKPDNVTGGVYQLRQGQQRRILVRVNPVQDSGTLPVICEAITSLAIGCVSVRSKLQKSLDSYQEEDLMALNDKWSEALLKRKTYLDEQIQLLLHKTNKTEEDLEREQHLIEQWVSLTEERNAFKCPAPGSQIPGAPADWDPPSGMERHVPVIFLDLNPDDMTNMSSVGDSLMVAGANSILPKEHGGQFYNLPIVKFCEKDVCAVAVWDSSMHDSPALNRVTTANERVYMILKASVRLSHPSVMEVVLRKRLAINVYKKQSISQMFKRKLVRCDYLTSTGVTYEVVSNIPKSSEDPEDRETLALMAASCDNQITFDGESYIEKYTKGVSAVESILTLDRLRQEVAIKELLTLKNNQQAFIRKTASVPNIGVLFGSTLGGSLSRLDHRSDSAFDISFLTNSAYEGFDRFRQKANSLLSGSNASTPNSETHSRSSLPNTPSDASVQSRSFGPTSPLNSMSPHSTKFMKPMKTVIEEHNQNQFNEEDEEEYEEEEEEEEEEEAINANTVEEVKAESSNNISTNNIPDNRASTTVQPESKSNNAGTPSMSSGYGSQPLLETPVSSEESISLHSNNGETISNTLDESVMSKLSPVTTIKEEINKFNGNTSPSSIRIENKTLVYSDNDNDSLSSYGSRGDFVSVGDCSVNCSLPEWLTIGESVRISPDFKTGVVAFIGTTHFSSGVWVGIILDSALGKNNGSVDGVQYFSCKPRYGLFVRPDKLKLDSRSRSMRLSKSHDGILRT